MLLLARFSLSQCLDAGCVLFRPTVLASQQHQHPSNTSIPEAPVSQLHQHPCNTSILAVPASQLYCYPIANQRRCSALGFTLDPLNTPSILTSTHRICILLKSQLCKTPSEAQGRSGQSLVVPRMSNAIVHQRSRKEPLGLGYK